MPDDEVVDADDEWDDEEWETEDLLFGYPARTVKIAAGATAVVVLLLLVSLVSTSIGFYSGVANLQVQIDPEEHYFPDDVELNAQVLANAPAFGRLAKEGTYSIYYDGAKRTSGDFTLSGEGRKNLRIDYEDFFVDNGEYTLKIEIDGKEASDSVELNLIAKTVEASTPFSGGPQCYREKKEDPYECDPVFTTISFYSSTNLVERDIVAPEGEGQLEIYFYPNDAPDDNEIYDESYWQDDNERDCSGEAEDCYGNEWALLTTITFALGFTSGSWAYETGNPTEFDKDVGYISYQMELDTDMFRQDDDGDYTMRITFNNTYNSEVDGADTEEKLGRSDYRWLFLEGKDN